MNVYDFDKTIFYPDSSYCFIMFCLKKMPFKVMKTLPGVTAKALGKLLGKNNTAGMKEKIFSFLSDVADPDALVKEFWACHWDNIQNWYLRQKLPDDLIISASPEFLLRPAADRLGVQLMGTPMDKHTGKIIGENCHDEEKVRRFLAEYPDTQINEFYSDSLHDTPMAQLARRAFIVSREELSPWPKT